MAANGSSTSTLVMKFGGTSVGTPTAMSQTAQIIQSQQDKWERIIVVTSALTGITDLLLKSANLASQGDRDFSKQAKKELLERHKEIVNELITRPEQREKTLEDINVLTQEFSSLCEAIFVLGEATSRALDAVASLGERMAVRLLAAILESRGTHANYIDANRIIVTDSNFQAAHPNFELTKQASQCVLNEILDQGIVPIVTGFIGANPNGVITTLGRGGSDYTAAILGAVIPADEVWIWTDVNGVMSADPRLVADATTIEQLSYREVSELAYFGAKVLHPKTIRPVIDAGIGLRVLNTFNPDHSGTRLVAEENILNHKIVKSVTAIRGLKLVTLEGRGMLGVSGVAARTFTAIASTGTSVSLITQASSEQSICFTVPIEASEKVISALEQEFSREISGKDIDRVWATGEVVIVTVVGDGMRNTPGISGKVFTALGDEGLNVIAIAQGSSEVSISFILSAEDTKKAVQTLHRVIIRK